MKNFERVVMNAIHGFFNQNLEDGRILTERLKHHVRLALTSGECGWISVKEDLPKIPEGQYGISVLVATFDSVFEEHCIEQGGPAGRGYRVHECSYGSLRNREGKKLGMFEGSDKEFDFKELYIGGEQRSEWGPTGDPVRFWMYLPDPPVDIVW